MLYYNGQTAGGDSRQHNGNVYNTTNYHGPHQQPQWYSPQEREQQNENLVKAAGEGQLQRVQYLLRRNAVVDALISAGAEVNAAKCMDYLGKAVASNTALGFATDSRNTDMMQALIRAGADVNVENRYVYLNRAILMKRYSVTKVLLAAGADMERSSMGFTALEWASLTSDEHVVELLIAAGANPNAVAPNVGTILHYVAIFHGNEEITRMLVRSGARTNIPDINGKTAVDLAKKLGRTSMLKILESSNNGRSL